MTAADQGCEGWRAPMNLFREGRERRDQCVVLDHSSLSKPRIWVRGQCMWMDLDRSPRKHVIHPHAKQAAFKRDKSEMPTAWDSTDSQG